MRSPLALRLDTVVRLSGKRGTSRMRETKYAREIVSTDTIGGGRIERIYVKENGQEEIRFSWWREARLIPRPLDLPETELLELMRDAIDKGVFTPTFVNGLRNLVS
jgi:hypothetical protein